MLTRRKRPINLSKQPKTLSHSVPEFRPKQTLPPLDLLADFQFTNKSNIKLKDIDISVLFKDLYPYFSLYSLTACYVLLISTQFIWIQFHSQELRIKKLLDAQNGDVASFWLRLTQCFVYINFVLVFGAYLETVYKLWYYIGLVLLHLVGFIVFELKDGIGVNRDGHLYTAGYSMYWLVLVEKRMKSVNLVQIWMNIKAMPIWEKLSSLGKKQQQHPQSDLIDFGFTERPLSIKGGQTDDSFSYDSFFSYADPFDMTQQRKGYFQSNISKRSSNISHNLQPKKPSPSFYSKFASQKSLLHQSEIESTIASSQTIKKQKQEEEVQLIKIYKCFVLSFLVYSTVSKVEWIAYLVGGCGMLGCVEMMTNEKLKFMKFGCFLSVAIVVIVWV